MTQVSDERLAEMQQACGTPHPPTQETYWYRLAVSGEESPHALDWEDKPHRLVFGLCRIIEKEAALRSQPEPAGVKEAVEPDAYIDWKTQCVWPVENIKDSTGLQPVWYTSPSNQQPVTVTDEMAETEIRYSAFGDRVAINMPAGFNLVIVGYHKGQFRPHMVRLPHQLYVADITKMLNEVGSGEAMFLPARSEDYVSVMTASLSQTQGE